MFVDALRRALSLLASLDADVLDAACVSITVSGAATLLALLLGLPLGVLIGLSSFRGRRAAVAVINALMALPTVVVGLVVYALLSRSGPLGGAGLLYTRGAMVIGQAVLAFPIVAGLAIGALEHVDPRLRPTAWTLGAGRAATAWLVVREARFALVAAGAAAFGRVFSEVGVSMMLGGNLKGETRNLATGIALETGKGEFALGLALGAVLLGVALAVNGALAVLRAAERRPR
jgi:tungstate transport system permease protein